MNSTERFTTRGADYQAGRPSYPDAAIDALLDGLGSPNELTIVDLGAGTGIGSRLLAERGARVVAIEPNDDMRSHAESHRNLSWHKATAEETGLPSSYADLVTVFQAFHWFNHSKAIAEMERLLKPTGHAAIVYNERDKSDDFAAAYDRVAREFSQARETHEPRRTEGLKMFESHPGWKNVRRFSFENSQHLTQEELRARAASTSYLPNTGSDAERLVHELDTIFMEFERDGTVTMPMATIVVIANR